MSTLETRLKDHGYNNWVKGGLSLGVAKDGIENFVEQNTDQFHLDVMNSLSAGANCRNCSTENVIPCNYNNNFCKFVNRKCSVHDSTDPNKRSQKCPNSVCDNIRLAIIKEHRFNGPAWRNTDCRCWCREPWQLAKCFMSQGYQSSTLAADTDFPGLLSVVINHKMFDNQVTDNLAFTNNVFCQAREVRNKILHKAVMKLTDQELKEYITILKTMLSDPKCLSGHPDALKAKDILDKILNDQINITTEDERQIRSLREMELKKQEVLAKIEAETDDAKEHIRKKMKVAEKDINVQKKKAIDAVKKELTDIKDDTVACVRKELTEAKDVIKVEKKEAIVFLQTALQETCSMKKKGMKAHLISKYQQDEQLSAPLFPLVLNDQRHIDELYVKPNMKIKSETIDSYKDLFKDERRKIYVVGDAGLGKTSLCQKMVSTWCRIQAETIEDMSDDELAMGKFDFLFYISLREAVTESNVEDMIKYQLLAEEFYELLPTVLKNEKVLVILDGLDEWSGDSKVCKRLVNKGLPTIRIMGNGTILTTTRPWKLEAIQLKSTQIDANVELLGIAEDSSNMLIQIIINQLNMENKSNKKMEDFTLELNHKQLEHLRTIPVVLKQLLCLWYSGKQLGKNMSIIYCQMLELLLELGQTRLEKDPNYTKKQAEWINSSIKLPACFNGTDQCQDHKPLILALGKVAFQTILSENRESSLVFKRSQAEIHGMTAEDINICLNIGILSQSGVVKNAMSHRKISFLHKTYQEFLAALFVSVIQTESDECVQTLQRVCKSEEEFLDKEKLFKFINGISSETTCKLMAHIRPLIDNHNKSRFLKIDYNFLYPGINTHGSWFYYLVSCLNDGWNCSHDNEHLNCDDIIIFNGMLTLNHHTAIYSEEEVQLLSQVNIHNMKSLIIKSQPTAQCLGYLLQVTTLKSLSVYDIINSRSSYSSEDTLYDLIQNNKNTLTYLLINTATLRSRTKLVTLLNNVPHLSRLYIWRNSLSQQLLDSLQDFKAQRPDIRVRISNPTILADTWCTD